MTDAPGTAHTTAVLERARRRARKTALATLYAAAVSDGEAIEVGLLRESLWSRPIDPDGAAADDIGVGDAPATSHSDMTHGLAADLVEGVTAHQQELDGALADAAEHWALDRMPRVDLVLLRVALYELRHRSDIPTGATINEAIELAKCYSTSESSRFVNGVLGRLAGDAEDGIAGDAEDGIAGDAGDAHERLAGDEAQAVSGLREPSPDRADPGIDGPQGPTAP